MSDEDFYELILETIEYARRADSRLRRPDKCLDVERIVAKLVTIEDEVVRRQRELLFSHFAARSA